MAIVEIQRGKPLATVRSSDVQFSVEAGEVVTIIGSSGSEKSPSCVVLTS